MNALTKPAEECLDNIVDSNNIITKVKHRIGLVFDGGGAKGAYQIGVWRALRETGLEQYVTDIAGTSVGGLNAALFVKGDLEEAEYIWSEELSSISPLEIQIGVSELIDSHLSDMSFFEKTNEYHRRPINCFITACNKSKKSNIELVYTQDKNNIIKCVSGRAEYFNMRFLSMEDRSYTLNNATLPKEVLLATSAIPVLCQSLKIDRKRYQDGGVVDNSPAYPLLEATNCDTIIVVHLDSDKASYSEIYSDNVSILEITPSQDTGHFIGTLDFSNQKGQWLMKLGYNDTKKVFEEIIKNWAKENLLTDNGENMFEIIEHMSLEDKYRLYSECEFLVRGNYAKLNYISEEGFGKTIIRVITGRNSKTKKQILKNSVALQGKMMSILVCLDDEMQNIKQGMHYLFYRSLAVSDILLTQHRESKTIIETLKTLIMQNEYNGKFLADKFSEYNPIDMSNLKKQLDDITIGINSRIAAINELNNKALEIHNAQTEATAKRIFDAKQVKLLRVTPQKIFILTSKGVDEKLIDESDIHNYRVKKNIVADDILNNYLNEYDPALIILPEGHKHPPRRFINPADYFMYLWFVNTPVPERSGKYVYMIDYCNSKLYLYGYKVSEDGKDYSEVERTEENIINKNSSTKKIHNKIAEILNNDNKDGYNIFRTFETVNEFLENRLDKTDYNVTIEKVAPEWENALSNNDGELFVSFVDRFINKIYE